MNEILTLIFKCLGALIGSALLTIVPKVHKWLNEKIEAKKDTDIYCLIQTLVESAEQTLKKNDSTGQLRKTYVENCLKDVGVEITSQVNAYIESAVFNLPKDTK